jgi:hypothetical protein
MSAAPTPTRKDTTNHTASQTMTTASSAAQRRRSPLAPSRRLTRRPSPENTTITSGPPNNFSPTP